MTLDEIKKFLADNKDDAAVKAFLAELGKVSPEAEKAVVAKWLEGDDGKKTIQSAKDKEVEKAIETWKTNNLEKLVSEEYLKKNPPKDPEKAALEARIAAMEKKSADDAAALKRQELKSIVAKEFSAAKISAEYVDFLVGSDEESTKKNIEAFKKAREAELKEIVEAKFKSIGRDVPTPGEDRPGKTITRSEFEKLSPAEKAAAAKTDSGITIIDKE